MIVLPNHTIRGREREKHSTYYNIELYFFNIIITKKLVY